MRTKHPWACPIIAGLFLTASASSQAMPPHTSDRGFREGANHHLGDDSFVARFGRRPTSQDAEALRMRTHFEYVRQRLVAAAATRPELAPMRATILAALDDYIAKGTTPENDHLPWRNPVFIDDAGTICAVGYLIERTAGRELAEKVAATHRYDMIEDITVAMPEVAAWVAASGLTLDEIASIQPGYEAPIVETWRPWNLATATLRDGAFERTDAEGELAGTVRGGRMDGAWIRRDAHGAAVGSGEMKAGAGTWTSLYPDGKRMAVGLLEQNKPEGEWRLYHPSGNLAAEGRFRRAVREGRWQFFQDVQARVLLAEGTFSRGRVSGDWRHFDQTGALIATSSGTSLEIVPGPDHMQHTIDQGNVNGDHHRLDMLKTEEETLYLHYDSGDVYDTSGHKLAEADGAWTASDCKWTAERIRSARAGDVAALDEQGPGERSEEACVEPKPVEPVRAARIAAMLASVRAVRSVSPDFVRKLALGESVEDAAASEGMEDLTKVLAENMTWYVEWPHVDGRFIALYRTLPGYAHPGTAPSGP